MSDNEFDSGIPTRSYHKELNCIKNILAYKTKMLVTRHQDFHELECRFQTYFQKLYDQRSDIIFKSLNPVNPPNPVPYMGPVYQLNQPSQGFVNPQTGLIAPQPLNPAQNASQPLNPAQNAPQPLNPAQNAPQPSDVKPAEPNVQEPSYPEPDGISSFWLTTLQHEETTARMIRKGDEHVLKYLTDIKCVMIEKPSSYVLEFHFMPNAYFENTVLTKYYKMRSEIDADDPFAYKENVVYESIGCPIQWRRGKNVMHPVKQGKNGTGPVKRVGSFFKFFEPPRLNKRASAEHRQRIKEHLQLDYQIGEIIRTDIIPRAVLYYTDEMYHPEDDTE